VSVAEDPVTGHIWVGSRQLGLHAFNPKTKIGRYYPHQIDEKSSLSVNARAFYFDEQKNLWSGSSQGLFRLNRKTDQFETIFGRNEDGSITRIYSLYIDRSKNFWIGTEISGLRIADLKPRKFEQVDNSLLSNPVIWSIYEDVDGFVWLATEKGITILDPTKTKSEFVLAKEQEPLLQSGDYIITITGNENLIWAGTTFSGIIEIDRKTKKYRYIDSGVYSKSNFINILAYNQAFNELVIGSFEGLGIYRFDQKKLDWYNSNPSDSLGILNTDVIWSIYFDKEHHTWFTHDTGISAFNSKKNDIRHINPFQDSNIPNRSRATNVIAQDKNNFFWIGTENSLIKFQPKEDSVYYTFTTDDGLSNAYIYAVLVDKNNDIWVSTNKGLSQLSADPEEESGYHIRNYSVLDGLQSSEFNFNAYTQLRNGAFLFGGISGVNYFYPDRIQLNLFDTPAFISEVNINNGKEIDHFNLIGLTKIAYDYGPNVYEISLHALEFTAPAKNVFKYRLKGFETQWNEIKGKSKVIYTNLSPATYVFELKVANSDYIFGSNTARFELEIIPPFYLTNTFYASVLVLTAVIIFLGVNYRERKLREINEQLETEVQKRTRQLEKNEFIFKQISDNAADLISMLDREGIIIYASPSHHLLLGYQPEELDSKNVFDFMHEEDLDRIKAEISKLKEEGSITFSEYRLRHKNGTWRSYQTAGSVIRNDEIDDLRFVMISHDITRQKRIENYLIESKNEAQRANQAKSAFLAGISHELRTPLNAILGFSQILVKETNLTPKQAAYVETMLKSGNHLLDMINEVLDISRIEAGRMPVNYDNFSLKQLFKDIENIFRLDIQQKGLELHTFYEVGLPDYCFTDAGKLRQVLINLIGNALKFTENGYIRLHVSSESIQMHPKLQWNELVQAAEHSHSTGSRRLALKVVVEDTGRGIPSNKLQQIFEPFQQANAEKNYNEGTGLGLAISSRLLKLLGGSVDVKSDVNKGSIFECLIPVLIVETPSFLITDNTQRIIGIQNLKNPKVLLVDDIEYNHTLLQDILEPIGFICSKVYNGKEAIEMAETYSPDLIMMDLKMPVMDGIKSTKQIRKSFGNQIKIIAISASGFDDNELERKAAGFDAFILKPFKETLLLQTISQVLSLDYVYEDELPEAEKTTEELKNALILKDIKALGEYESDFWDAVELMDWEKLSELNAQFHPSSELYAYISEALENKDFMALIKLSEKWKAD
jgi:PAS domain S-box-containing protein